MTRTEQAKRWFEGRKLIVATHHKKEDAIIPALQPALGIIPVVPDELNTDSFGTFSGEVERTAGPLAAARQKCLLALELYGCDLAVASEGSFGPHPALPFLPADDELLLLVDIKNKLEIVVREVTTQTNFNKTGIQSQKQLIEFANQCLFPSHALVLTGTMNEKKIYHKGITQKEKLLEIYEELANTCTSVTAETDMRAMYNPTRMKVIAKAAVDLSHKILCACPACAKPGFGITATETGLPCGWCGSPTHMLLKHIYSCHSCNYINESLYPDGNLTADPMYCPRCNP